MKQRFVRAIRFSKPSETGAYFSKIPAIEALICAEELEFSSPVTFFCGENGSGKSTLLEAIAVCAGFNAEGGSRNFCFSTRPSHSDLYRNLTLVRDAYPKDGFFLRAESVYNVSTNLEQNGGNLLSAYGGKNLHEMSHGESFLSIVLNRFGGEGLYLLDEPEAALSVQNQLTLLSAMRDLVERGSQFLICTHSPVLLGYPDAAILEFSESGVRSIKYRESAPYQLTKAFLDAPERFLHHLMD